MGGIRPAFGYYSARQKASVLRGFVRLEFGSASALYGIKRRLVAQQLKLNFHSSTGLVALTSVRWDITRILDRF
jgi:hypothetical protein